MCLSRLGQILYGTGCLVAIALIVAGAMTPGWKEIEVPDTKEKVETGLFKWACKFPSGTGVAKGDREKFCKDWWENIPQWQKTVAVLVGIGIAAHIIGIIVNVITCCCIWGRNYMLTFQAIIALVALIVLVVAVAIFGFKYRDDITVKVSNYKTNQASYSFYMVAAGAGVSLFNVIVAFVSAWLAKQSCCL